MAEPKAITLLENDEFELPPKRWPGGRAFLAFMDSPRYADIPEFGDYLDWAAANSAVSPLLLAATAQTEQSFLTRETWASRAAEGWAWDWCMGCGVRQHGTPAAEDFVGVEQQTDQAAYWLRYWYDHPQLDRPMKLLDGTRVWPANRATFALLKYRPDGIPPNVELAEFLRELEGRLTKLQTGTDIAIAAVRAALAHQVGKRTGYQIAECHFELAETDRCAEFVRECYEAVVDWQFPWCAADARGMEQRMIAAKRALPHLEAGACLCFNRGSAMGQFGHTGVYVGRDRHERDVFAENTSSTTRGPGTVLSVLSPALRRRLSGIYRMLPKGVSLLREYLVKDPVSGKVLSTFWLPEGKYEVASTSDRPKAGDHLADQEALYVSKKGAQE